MEGKAEEQKTPQTVPQMLNKGSHTFSMATASEPTKATHHDSAVGERGPHVSSRCPAQNSPGRTTLAVGPHNAGILLPPPTFFATLSQ